VQLFTFLCIYFFLLDYWITNMIDFKLYKHQKQAVEMARDKKHLALLMDAGVGKTPTTIQILREVYATHGRILPTLVLCPVIVVKNWAEEWEKFSRVPTANVIPLIGPTKKRIAHLQKAQSQFGRQFIAITNYEALVSSKPFYEEISDWQPMCMVLDESHRLKSPTSKRTKLVIKLADNAEYKYILTGTPILNNPLDIFAQYRVLDGGETFGSNYFSFRANYFYDENSRMPSHVHFPSWVIRPDSYGKIHKLIYRKAIRAKKEEVLDLPPLISQKIFVELSPKIRKAYESMLANFISILDDKVVTAEIALTKTLRMLQIVNGFIKDEDGKESSIDSPKKAALKELLSDICTHSKVLVWACFKQNYEQIRDVCNSLKISYVEAHGGTSNKQKYAAVDAFNNDPKIKVFIGHPASLGIGINLVPASYSIYFSRTFSLEHDIQSEARNYRSGSEIHTKITRYDLVAKDTIDEVVLEALKNKVGESEKILSLLRNSLTFNK